MKVLSVTSHVCFGHVGAQASVLPLQRLGHDVCLVPTVLLSNHPGYGGLGGGPVKLVRLDDLMQNLIERGLLAQCGAAHSGYLGQPGTAAIARRGIDGLRAARPEAPYLCDPVFGDNGRLYVPEGVVDDIRTQLLPVADIATPNAFELSVLSGLPCDDPGQALAACRALQSQGPGTVVCTSAAAQARAAAAVHGLIAASVELGDSELALIEAQHEIVAPTLDVTVERIT